jgi:hypothetical protein
MIVNEIPKKDLNKVPDDFFENQLSSIFRKTIDIDNWSLPGTKNIESQFMVPDGYWLQMEDGIRSKTIPQANKKYVFAKSWQLATIIGTFLVFTLSVFYYLQNTKAESENWSAQVNELSYEELVAGIDIEKPEIQELTELLAANHFNKKKPDFQSKDLNNQDIEETLENINSSDLINDLEIN